MGAGSGLEIWLASGRARSDLRSVKCGVCGAARRLRERGARLRGLNPKRSRLAGARRLRNLSDGSGERPGDLAGIWACEIRFGICKVRRVRESKAAAGARRAPAAWTPSSPASPARVGCKTGTASVCASVCAGSLLEQPEEPDRTPKKPTNALEVPIAARRDEQHRCKQRKSAAEVVDG